MPAWIYEPEAAAPPPPPKHHVALEVPPHIIIGRGLEHVSAQIEELRKTVELLAKKGS